MIYIATDIHGQGVKHVTAFDDRAGFHNYAYETMAFDNDNWKLRGRPTIDAICEALYDTGIGIGARSHYRIDREQAKELVRAGLRSHNCWHLESA
jgi:hypothetical protein